VLVFRRVELAKFRHKDDLLHYPGLSIHIPEIGLVTIMKTDVSVFIAERLHLCDCSGPALGAESSRVAGAIGETTTTTLQFEQTASNECREKAQQGTGGTSRR
jgi:hypothetical protein